MENVVLHVVMAQWLNLKKMQVKYSTFVKYKKVIECHIDPYFGRYTAHDLNEALLYDFFMLKKEEVSGSMLQTMRYLLKAILSYACRDHGYPVISLDQIRLSMNKPLYKGLTKDEEQRLSSYGCEHLSALSLSILLGLYAGMRIGEICALRWQDVDLEEGLIQVHHTVQRLEKEDCTQDRTSLFLTEPKSHSSERAIPLIPFLQHYLRRYQECHGGDQDVFVISQEKKPLDPRTLQYRYKQLCQKMDIQQSFHSLRHRFATSCIENQVDVKSLSEVLGHADITTTLRRYVHSSMEFKKKQLSKLAVPPSFAE